MNKWRIYTAVFIGGAAVLAIEILGTRILGPFYGRVLQAFYKAGLVNDMDVARQETLLHNTKGMLPVLTSTAKNLIHRLSVLLGQTPASLKERLAHSMPLPVTLPNIPTLLPSSVLEQRPDLRLAHTEVSAAAASLGAARANLFPKFVLSASGGFGALAVGGFPGLAEGVYALGAGLTAPIFNAGRIKAHITAADARLDHVATNYEKTFLLALEDTENAYVAHTAALERRDQLGRAEAAAERSHTHAFYQRGAADFLSVLDAKRTRLATSDERTQAETAVRVSLVSIYKAFGGGWSGESSISHPPS
jgi:outer membrane protein TolC